MYRFAYLYVRLGYFLAAVVAVLSVIFFLSSIVLLQAEKRPDSASGFNYRADSTQRQLIQHLLTVKRTFNLDSSDAEASTALKTLLETDWQEQSVTPEAADRLNLKWQQADRALKQLRSSILKDFTSDIESIIAKLSEGAVAPVPSSTNSMAGDKAPDRPDENLANAAQLYASGVNLEERINGCKIGVDYLMALAGEAKSPDNQAALQRAAGKIVDFVKILEDQIKNASRSQETTAGGNANDTANVPSVKPTRKEDTINKLRVILAWVDEAVTSKWAAEESLKGIQEEIKDFTESARSYQEKVENRRGQQLGQAGLLLLSLLAALFVAVGSDLVRAVLDSAMWLSHIGSNIHPRE